MKHFIRSIVYFAVVACACLITSCDESEHEFNEIVSDQLGEAHALEEIQFSEWEYRDHEGGVYHYFKFEGASEDKANFTYQEYYFEQGSRPQYEVKVTGRWIISGASYMGFDIYSVSCTNQAYLPPASAFPEDAKIGYYKGQFVIYYNKHLYEKIE